MTTQTDLTDVTTAAENIYRQAGPAADQIGAAIAALQETPPDVATALAEAQGSVTNVAYLAFQSADLLTATTALATDLTPPAASVPTLGIYTAANSVSAAESLASTLGVDPLPAFSIYCDGTSWSSIGAFKPPTLPSGMTLLLGVDLTPNSTGLSAVAANVASFTALAKNLIGTPTIIRLGWEFNGSWMPWGTGANGNTVAEYNPAVSLVIPAMKAANSALKFDFCCNASPTLAVLEQYYGSNGGELWDYIGGDHYDNPGGGGNASQLGAAVQLASAQGKPLSIGEWGLNGADNPTFINDMAQVILDPAAAAKTYGWPAYTVAYHSYFSADLSTNSDITQFPNSEAAFKANFG